MLLVAPNYVEPRGSAQHATPGTEPVAPKYVEPRGLAQHATPGTESSATRNTWHGVRRWLPAASLLAPAPLERVSESVPGVACCAKIRKTTWFGATSNTWHGVGVRVRSRTPRHQPPATSLLVPAPLVRVSENRPDSPRLRHDRAAAGLTARGRRRLAGWQHHPTQQKKERRGDPGLRGPAETRLVRGSAGRARRRLDRYQSRPTTHRWAS